MFYPMQGVIVEDNSSWHPGCYMKPPGRTSTSVFLAVLWAWLYGCHCFGQDWNVLWPLVRMDMKFCEDIHSLLMVQPNDKKYMSLCIKSSFCFIIWPNTLFKEQPLTAQMAVNHQEVSIIIVGMLACIYWKCSMVSHRLQHACRFSQSTTLMMPGLLVVGRGSCSPAFITWSLLHIGYVEG